MRKALTLICALTMGLCAPLLGFVYPEQAAAATSNTQKRSNLQKEQRSIKGQLSSIKKEINRKEARLDQANSELRQSEKAISTSNRTLKELGEKKSAVENQLSDLKREAQIVGAHVKDAEDIVSLIGQAQFVNSRRHPWQAALTGGNPNDIGRLSAMLRYMAREQSRTIDRLENRKKNIDLVTAKTIATRKELNTIERDEQKNRDQLELDKSRRQVALEKLKKEISTHKERYEQLVKNDRQLTNLITQIDRRIAQAQQAERRRQAKELAQAKSRKQSQTAYVKPDPSRTTVAPAHGSFGKLRGKLLMPTNGRIVARFGQKREGAAANLAWRGLLIRAKLGQDVRATAAGTVVFSDWMRGFGNLLILDHGSNYLSVYANNETLYKSVGERVKRGDTIASVGRSGGEDYPGLYFELRYKGKPFDPTRWVAK